VETNYLFPRCLLLLRKLEGLVVRRGGRKIRLGFWWDDLERIHVEDLGINGKNGVNIY
jgi:hypothetical protein